jgi:hypothetical protein
MSMESAAAFFDNAIADDAVRSKLVAAIADKEPEDKAEAAADLGKSLGFDFTADEALLIRGATRKAMIAGGNLDEELDDLDLQAVTGGSLPPLTAHLLGQGVGAIAGQLSRFPSGALIGPGVAKGTEAAANGGGLQGFVTGFVTGVADAGQKIGDVERKIGDVLSSW